MWKGVLTAFIHVCAHVCMRTFVCARVHTDSLRTALNGLQVFPRMRIDSARHRAGLRKQDWHPVRLHHLPGRQLQ